MRLLLNLLKKEKKGQALVEYAAVLPILILLIVGIVQFGIIFSAQVTITAAAREAVRLASLGEKDVGRLISHIDTVVGKQNLLDVQVGAIVFSPTITISNQDFINAELGDPVNVVIPATAPIIVPFLGRVIGETYQLRAIATMRYQAYD